MLTTRFAVLPLLLGLVAATGGWGVAAAVQQESRISGCVGPGGVLRVAASCTSAETAISWNERGPTGPPGPPGPVGPGSPALNGLEVVTTASQIFFAPFNRNTHKAVVRCAEPFPMPLRVEVELTEAPAAFRRTPERTPEYPFNQAPALALTVGKDNEFPLEPAFTAPGKVTCLRYDPTFTSDGGGDLQP